MRKKYPVLIFLCGVIAVCCLLVAACSSIKKSGDSKTISISIKATAEVGESVKLEKSASFSPFYQDNIKYEFIGNNDCNAEFSHVLDTSTSWWNTYVIASKSGSVSIKLSYVENGKVVAESNVVSISFKAKAISSVAELKAINGTTDSYELASDIDLGGDEWAPFDFAGSLSGAGHSIKNLVINSRADNVGLFGTLTGGVYNLKVEDASITVRGAQSNIGIIAGINRGEINRCSVSGTVDASAASYVGGLAGKVDSSGQIINSTNNCTVTGSEYTGGIAGYICRPNNSTFKGNTNSGIITGTTKVGGIAGYITNVSTESDTTINIENNINEGYIEGESVAGGLFGKAEGYSASRKISYNNYAYYYGYIEFVDCKNKGEVKSNGEKIGGLIGEGTYVSVIMDCENLADITGGTYVGGYIGYAYRYQTAITRANNENTVTGISYVGGITGSGGDLNDCENSGEVISRRATTNGVTYIGGLAGECGSITRCKNSADISGIGNYVGGLAGKCGDISKSQNYGKITGNSDYTGGLAGSSGSVSDCTNEGDVSGGAYTGGLVGDAYGRATGTNIFDSNKNMAKVEGRNYSGGLVGYLSFSDIVISSCENDADVTGGNYTGGLAGYISGATVTGFVNNNTITGKAYLGGVVGDGSKLTDCENYGSIVSTGTVTERDKDCSYVGGIAGRCSFVTNCLNAVDITARGVYVGGIAGCIIMPRNTNMKGNINSGNITGTTYVGGISGYLTVSSTNSDTTTIAESNTNEGDIVGESEVGGLFGRVEGYEYAQYVSYNRYTYYYGYFELVDSTNKGNIKASREDAGGLIGEGYYISTIDKCENSADVTGENYTGGLAGYVKYNVKISNSVNYNTITGKAYLGGIIGSAGDAQLFDCENYGSIISTGTKTENGVDYSYVGGLAGKCAAAFNCKNTVDIAANGAYVGGIAGYISMLAKVNMNNNLNTGEISGTKYVGGIAGYLTTDSGGAYYIEKNTNDGNVTGTSNVGGLFGTVYGGSAEIEMSDCQNYGDVKASSSYAGGLFGHTSGVKFLTRCSNSAKVTGTSYTGELYGYSENDIVVQ